MNGKPQDTLKFYETQAAELAQLYEDVERNRQIEFIKSYLPKDGLIFEIGSGSGAIAAALLNSGFNVIPSDASAAMREQALHYHSELADRYKLICFPVKTEFADNYFDAVIANAVLIHFRKEELKDILLEISRILKPQGILYVLVQTKRADTNSDGFDAKGRYFNLMSITAIAEICQDSKLKLEYLEQVTDGLNRQDFEVEHAILRKL